MLAGHLEQRFYCLLRDLMWIHEQAGDADDPVASLAMYVKGFALVETFDDADLLTAERGLVITTDSREEFHITITRRR